MWCAVLRQEGERRQRRNFNRQEYVSRQIERDLEEDNDDFFLNPLPFLKVTMEKYHEMSETTGLSLPAEIHWEEK